MSGRYCTDTVRAELRVGPLASHVDGSVGASDYAESDASLVARFSLGIRFIQLRTRNNPGLGIMAKVMDAN